MNEKTTPPPLHRIGFIGLGRMGEPMAARLIGAGFELRLLDADRARVDAFIASHGGTACSSVAEAALDADAVVTMLPSDGAVRSVMLDPGGVVETLRPGSLAIDMSTSSPTSTRAIAERLAEARIPLVDAPVMGGVMFARNGSLEVMVGGDRAAVDRCDGLFAALAGKVYRCGGVGTGHTLKAIANFVNTATLSVFAEAMSLGQRAGLDDAFMASALATLCTGRQHPLDKKIVPQVLTGRYASGMAMALTTKDLGIAAALGPQIGAATPIATGLHALWEQASAELGPQADHTEIARWWRDGAGSRPGNDA
jgi:3-hydroxyisobutyrate dehydrogenase